VAGGPVGRVDPPIQGPAHRGFDQPAGQILLHGGASFLPGFPPGKAGALSFSPTITQPPPKGKGQFPPYVPKENGSQPLSHFCPTGVCCPMTGTARRIRMKL